MKKLFSLDVDYTTRIFGLDVFRAVAILIVVMGHGGFIIDQALPGFPYIWLIDGVELFFVLSGFLIGSILIRTYEQKGTLAPVDLLRFWKRRWFRTVPNYYLILLLNIVLVTTGTIGGNPDRINWKFFFFLQNFASPFTDFFWESWSLTVEEWFYILLPLTLFIVHKMFGKFLEKKYVVLVPLILFTVVPLAYRIAVSSAEVDPFWYDVQFRKLVITRLDAIMYGVLFAWIRFYAPVTFRKMAVPAFVAGIVLVYFFMYLHGKAPTGMYAKTIYFSAIGCAASMLLPLASLKTKFTSWFGKAITHISVVSYSMYLVNLAPVAQVIEQHFKPVTPVQGLAMYVIYWTVVIGGSTLLYKYFEKPAMDLRDSRKRI